MHTKLYSVNLKRGHLEDLVIDGSIILNRSKADRVEECELDSPGSG
jgi:hypothetical protein